MSHVTSLLPLHLPFQEKKHEVRTISPHPPFPSILKMTTRGAPNPIPQPRKLVVVLVGVALGVTNTVLQFGEHEIPKKGFIESGFSLSFLVINVVDELVSVYHDVFQVPLRSCHKERLHREGLAESVLQTMERPDSLSTWSVEVLATTNVLLGHHCPVDCYLDQLVSTTAMLYCH